MRRIIAGLAVLLMACGGAAEDANQGQAAADQAAAAPMADAQMAGTGVVHEVHMELVDGSYRFSPNELTIKVGDTVRWTNVSGGPHNVAFWADSIPAGAAEVLNGAMSGRMGSLVGGLLTAPNATYEIVFAGAPVGEYGYYCTPHLPLGMVAGLTIEE
jgi:plastocyanin